MNLRNRFVGMLCLSLMLAATVVRAQDAPAAPSGPGSPEQGQRRMREGQDGPPPVFGKITAINENTIEVSRPDGQAVTIKVTAQTEFRKDRQPAKAADFKVGDMIMVRGDENPDHTVTAKSIGARTGGFAGGPGGGGPGGGPGQGGMFFGGGTLGKDFVIGEVKAIDPPRITIVRTDNVKQTLELNENTTLRRARESITMADIQVGDHVAARGALQGDVFVPVGLMVMSPEMWQRFQDFQAQRPGGSGTPAPAPKP